MAMKKSVWDMILKVVIAVASAVAGVLVSYGMSLFGCFYPFAGIV